MSSPSCRLSGNSKRHQCCGSSIDITAVASHSMSYVSITQCDLCITYMIPPTYVSHKFRHASALAAYCERGVSHNAPFVPHNTHLCATFFWPLQLRKESTFVTRGATRMVEFKVMTLESDIVAFASHMITSASHSVAFASHNATCVSHYFCVCSCERETLL